MAEVSIRPHIDFLCPTVKSRSRFRNTRYGSQVKVRAGLSTALLTTSMILRVSPDGTRALICQRSATGGRDFCDVLIADLTLDPPVINDVVSQVADGVESFAVHPNGKLAVATRWSIDHDCIAALDIAARPARLLYTLDAKGIGQGIEFTPEGDKLFVGSAIAGRIEVFDALGDLPIAKEPEIPQRRFRTQQPHHWAPLSPGRK